MRVLAAIAKILEMLDDSDSNQLLERLAGVARNERASRNALLNGYQYACLQWAVYRFILDEAASREMIEREETNALLPIEFLAQFHAQFEHAITDIILQEKIERCEMRASFAKTMQKLNSDALEKAKKEAQSAKDGFDMC